MKSSFNLVIACFFTLTTLAVQAQGTLDNTFATIGEVTIAQPGYQANAEMRVLATQPDGKILVVGQTADVRLSSINNSPMTLTRLNANGSFDATFNGGSPLLLIIGDNATSNVIRAISVQTDGKILLFGSFTI